MAEATGFLAEFIMKIELKATRFIGIDHAHLVFDAPLNIIMGENAQGKSSLRDAVLYSLGHMVRGIKKKDNDQLGSGSQWKTEFSIGNNRFRASRSTSPKIDDVSGALGVSRKALPFCLDPDLILEAKPKDLQVVLQEVLNAEQDWQEYLKERLDSEYHGYIEEFSGFTVKEVIKEAEKKRAENKQLNIPEPPEDILLIDGEKKVYTSDQSILPKIEKQLSSLKNDLEEKLEKYGAAKLSLPEDEIERLEDELATLNDAMIEHEERKARYNNYLEEKKKLHKEADKSEAKYAVEQKRINEIEAKEETFEKALNVNLCQDCREKLLAAFSFDKGRKQQLQKKTAAAEREMQKILEKANKLKEPEDPGDVSDMKARVAEIKAELKSANTGDGDVETMKDDIDKLRDRIEKGEDMRDKILKYQNDLKSHQMIAKENENRESNWHIYDDIAKTLQAMEKESVGSGLQPFLEKVHEQNILDGDISIDEDLNVLFNERPHTMLSTTEQYRLSLVLYFAVLRLFEFPFCMIDNGDLIVTEDIKKLIVKDLIRVSEFMPVIFIQAKTKAFAEKVKSTQKTNYFWVEGGTVKKL